MRKIETALPHPFLKRLRRDRAVLGEQGKQFGFGSAVLKVDAENGAAGFQMGLQMLCVVRRKAQVSQKALRASGDSFRVALICKGGVNRSMG